MGFMDFLGEMAGGLAAQGEVLVSYKREYEAQSDDQLKEEYKHLKNKIDSAGSWGPSNEVRDRYKMIVSVLRDRGYS